MPSQHYEEWQPHIAVGPLVDGQHTDEMVVQERGQFSDGTVRPRRSATVNQQGIRQHLNDEGTARRRLGRDVREPADGNADCRMCSRIQRHGSGRRLARAGEFASRKATFGLEDDLTVQRRSYHNSVKGSTLKFRRSTPSTWRAHSHRDASLPCVGEERFLESSPWESNRTLTWGRNGSLGCSAVTMPTSSVLSAEIADRKESHQLTNRFNSFGLNDGSSCLPMMPSRDRLRTFAVGSRAAQRIEHIGNADNHVHR